MTLKTEVVAVKNSVENSDSFSWKNKKTNVLKWKNVKLNCNIILEYYSFYCTFEQINLILANIKPNI